MVAISQNKRKEKREYVWDCIILLIMIIVSSQSLVFGTNSVEFFSTLVNLAILFFAAFFLFKANSKHVRTSIGTQRELVILVVFLLLSGLVNFEISFEYIMRVGILFAAYYYVCYIPYNRFRLAFENVILTITVWSIVFYLISFTVPSFLSHFGVVINASKIPFYNCYLCVIPATEEFRMYGPFREPGVFQILINLALLLHLTCNSKVSFWRVVVYFTGVILTFSTTGYICLILIVLHFALSMKERRSRGAGPILLLLVIGIALYFLYTKTDLFSIEGVVLGKIFDSENASSVSRYGSIVANLKFFGEDPIFGVGYNRVSELFPSYVRMALGEESNDNTNSILMNFATTGFIYGITYLVGFWKFAKRLSSSAFSSIFIFIIICLLLSGENINRFIVTFIFFFYGIEYFRGGKIKSVDYIQ